MQERPSASVTLMACGIVSEYSPPCSIVSKRSPDPFLLGSWGRFSGVISSNLWVSFIGASLFSFHRPKIRGWPFFLRQRHDVRRSVFQGHKRLALRRRDWFVERSFPPAR